MEVLAPNQVPKGLIAMPILQEEVAKMVNFIDSMVQAGVVPLSPVTSQTANQLVVKPTMFADELKRMDRFRNFTLLILVVWLQRMLKSS